MSFVTLAFVAFMALTAAVYFAVPLKARWVVLLVASYIFFFLNSEWLVLVLFAQTLATYLCGRWMAAMTKGAPDPKSLPPKERASARAALRKRKRRAMAVGIILNAGALLFLKYYNFFADNANILLGLAGIQLPNLGLIVPVGISFYTLQAIAYLVDIQRGKVEADTSLPKFMLFMSYFPQILQGPIPRFAQLAEQLYAGHKFDYKRFCFGAQLILWGFFKKLVIADRLAIPVNQIFDYWQHYDGLIVLLAAFGYGLQVYADFSGGVDIARGFSQTIGINLVDNFRQPYFSKSIEEFWRRWHITLGAWMRDYIFYPLSLSKAFTHLGRGARKVLGANIGKKMPPVLAMFIVYFLVGFWHGANWTFIAYGLWNSVFIMLGILLAERYTQIKKALHINEEARSWRVFQMVRTAFICSIGRFFTRAAMMSQALGMMRATCKHVYDLSFLVDGSLVSLGLDVANWVVLIVAIFGLLLVDIAHERGFSFREAIARQGIVVRWIIYLGAFTAVLIFGMYGATVVDAGFIYQRY